MMAEERSCENCADRDNCFIYSSVKDGLDTSYWYCREWQPREK